MTWQIKWVGKLPEGWKSPEAVRSHFGSLLFKSHEEAKQYADDLNAIGSFTEGSYQPVEIKE